MGVKSEGTQRGSYPALIKIRCMLHAGYLRIHKLWLIGVAAGQEPPCLYAGGKEDRH